MTLNLLYDNNEYMCIIDNIRYYREVVLSNYSD